MRRWLLAQAVAAACRARRAAGHARGLARLAKLAPHLVEVLEARFAFQASNTKRAFRKLRELREDVGELRDEVAALRAILAPPPHDPGEAKQRLRQLLDADRLAHLVEMVRADLRRTEEVPR